MKIIYLFGCFMIFSLYAFADDQSADDPGADNPGVSIFKYECRSAECTESVLKVSDMQKELKALRVTILAIARGFDGHTHYSAEDRACNKDLSRINIFTIPESDVQKALNADWILCSELEADGGKCSSSPYGAYSIVDQPAGVVSVYKTAGRLQCEQDSGVNVDAMEQELIDKKIIVYNKYQATDGMLHSLKCGVTSADINVYVIERSGLSEAESMGYQECVRLKEQGGACYPEVDTHDDKCL